ncbi:tyrosine-type recombinase/integrase [Pseudomonas sp. JUb52]|uniref:tyrosine-type recombinase/integrase n=1 Tax=Pseudomonas sp. JUb52 TaxID=2485127 RepID=UPI00104D48B0|nr:tyrosine-type recombinase/integrase [Pseudomonas sp. JUb52]TCQ84245.1 site-specific recombinase XerD [Pseudomonas sp. JUb52]
MATHLVQKPGESTWYVRLAIPVDVRHAFGGRVKLIRTTGTSNKTEAMEKRLPILAQWKADIAAARAGKAAAREGWRDEVAGEGIIHKARVDTALLYAIRNPTRPSPITPTEEELIARVADWYSQKDSLIAEVEAMGLTDTATQMRESFDRVFGASASEAVMIADEVVQGFSVEEAQQKYGLTPSETKEARTIVSEPHTYTPTSQLTPARLKAFREHREKAQIATKTIDQQLSKLQKLSAYLKQQGVSLNHDTVAAWLESLDLTSKTKTQYLLAGNTFWKWAMKNDARWKVDFAGVESPFREQELPKVRGKAKAEAARKAFTVEEIEIIFSQAKSEGHERLCDLIQFGSYTGARIEELCQLRADSIITIEGVQCFKIADSKTAAGIREIPVHPALVPLVERLSKETKDGYLLPSSGGNKYGVRSDSLSKAFGRLKSSLGFGTQHVFHSVRSMAVTQLLRKGVPGVQVADLVGHETGVITYDVYDQGASPRQKLEAISKLSYNFD